MRAKLISASGKSYVELMSCVMNFRKADSHCGVKKYRSFTSRSHIRAQLDLVAALLFRAVHRFIG